jgi:hypothetical protein
VKWKIYAWNKATKEWGLVGETDEDDKAEAAVRAIADAGHVARAEADEGTMRAHPGRGFGRLRWLKRDSADGTS